MEPLPAKSTPNMEDNEISVLKAKKYLKENENVSIRSAAKRFGVARTTLQDRLKGVKSIVITRENNHKLTKLEELSLRRWILSMDSRGAAPRSKDVLQMANLLLAKRGSADLQKVGLSWVDRYVKRQEMLRKKFSRGLDYKRAKCSDPERIRAWFDLIKHTTKKYGIQDDDIYNFDETGFAMGLIKAAKVITRSSYHDRRQVLQPGNREWVTTIECTSASGWALNPRIIFKGKKYIRGWFKGIEKKWRFNVSDNGWTNDKIAYLWLKNTFIPETTTRTKGTHRLLILDGHGSHLTPQFDNLCRENNIIALFMPPHSSHILQPLDFGCFSTLKNNYHSLIDRASREGHRKINKFGFLRAYPKARKETFSERVIKSSFASTGLVPLDPERVLSKLTIRLRTPSPPPEQDTVSEPITPTNQEGILKHEALMKSIHRQRSRSPSTPEKTLVRQLFKCSQVSMHKVAFLEHELKTLRETMEITRKDKARSRKQIPQEGDISVEEVLEQFPDPIITEELQINENHDPVPAILQPRQRSSRLCGICRKPGHRRETCSKNSN